MYMLGKMKGILDRQKMELNVEKTKVMKFRNKERRMMEVK